MLYFQASKITLPSVKLRALFTLALIFTIQFLSAQSTELDPEKWAVALSKKDPSAYDSLYQLIAKLQEGDSIRVFQFLDELAEKGRSKRDHFKALFNCLKARNIYNKRYYEFYRIGKTPVEQDEVLIFP